MYLKFIHRNCVTHVGWKDTTTKVTVRSHVNGKKETERNISVQNDTIIPTLICSICSVRKFSVFFNQKFKFLNPKFLFRYVSVPNQIILGRFAFTDSVLHIYLLWCIFAPRSRNDKNNNNCLNMPKDSYYRGVFDDNKLNAKSTTWMKESVMRQMERMEKERNTNSRWLLKNAFYFIWKTSWETIFE